MNKHTNLNCSPTEPFSAEAYREAMGPGYSVSLFKEQPGLTGQTGKR